MVASSGHLERLEVAGFEHSRTRDLGHDVQIARALESAGDARHARHLAHDVRNGLRRFPIRAFAQERAQASRYAMDGHHGKIAQQGFEVLEQPHFERRAIMALQADLMVVGKANALVINHGMLRRAKGEWS